MKDRFSKHAGLYASFRPLYPAELYEFIFRYVRQFGAAWDAGTGNGQAARELARRFEIVYATDISDEQLAHAAKADNIFYSRSGETIELPDHSLDLITVAQAVHWFDREKFYREAKRVGVPGCVLAIWGYGLLTVNNEIDPLIREFYVDVVGPFWDPERKHIDQQFKSIEFPFPEIQAPVMKFSFEWSLKDLEGYLSTWSSVRKYIQANQKDPVSGLIERVAHVWKESMEVSFPLFMRMGAIG